jgi:hypothetical protein
VFAPGKPFHLILVLVGKDHSIEEHLKGSSIGLVLALPTNNRLGWKGFPATNTLAYYENSY